MTFDRELLKNIPLQSEAIFSDDDRIETFREDTVYRGSPDAVVCVRDEKEVSEILAYCSSKKIPVTFCGSQTSMTGSSVCDEGLLVSTQALTGVIDISEKDKSPVVTVRPGTIVADMQNKVAERGYFFPVAATSRDECTIGANVATNATGEDSFKYGPIRPYVEELEIILPDGKIKTLSREKNESASWDRNRAGYFLDWKNPIDLIVGSEGTLAFISKITLKLLPPAIPFFTALIPFASNRAALDFVISVASGVLDMKPRALELIDSGALALMKTADGFPKIEDDINAFIYVKQEYRNDAEFDEFMMRWYEAAVNASTQSFADRILLAQTNKQKEDFRLWRHRIPELANEHGRTYWKAGGGKLGSDWWVPMPKLKEMMEYFYSIADESRLPYMAYAHIGAGHPHTNLLAKDPRELEIAHQVLLKACAMAAKLGGGVAGEHGLGKIHRDLLPIQYDNLLISKMKTWKSEYDPNWILGRGNIFSEK